MQSRCLAVAMTLVAAIVSRPAAGEEIYQLRTYELLPSSKERFHARFKAHALRIMLRHGFHVVAIWEADNNGAPQFVYLLRWRSETQMKAAWKAFMSDVEWANIKRSTTLPGAPIMGGIESKMMRLMDYSPNEP